MTSHRTKSSKMQATTKEKKRDLASSCKEKSQSRPNDKSGLPLLKKSVYMDVKHGKHAKTLEEQLRKLGATVEKFLSCDVNYVISSFCPINMRQEERPSTGEDNPQSPSFVPSPFSCGPSPTATSSDPKKNLVSRGKALAQIACAKKQTASTVISSAEKLGIKVVSVEVATKWLDRELKKIEGCKDKKENTQEKIKKIVKKRKKVLKGAYIKFEACNRMYRPIKSELDRWPKLNPSAPPGLNPFTEVKMKVPHNVVNVRRQLLMRNKRTAYGGSLSSKMRIKRSCSKLSGKDRDSGIKPVHMLPDFVGVPITTAGDVKRNMENHWKRRPEKLQGYCECCEEKYKDLNQHLSDERHRVYSRNKSNYESLDALISEISPPADFLQNLLLHHCSQKQTEPFPKCDDKRLKDALPALCLNVASPISSIQTGNISHEDIAALDLCTPQLDQDISSDARLNSEAASKEGCEKSDKRPQAVVIRRPTASGIFTSPRRRQPTPSKKPWVQERCMVFRDSPMASLQPSNAASQIHFKVSEHVLKNPYPESIFTMGESKPPKRAEQLSERKQSPNSEDELITPSLHRMKPSSKSADVKGSEYAVSVPISGTTSCQSNLKLAGGSNETDMSEPETLPHAVDSTDCPSSHEDLHGDDKGESKTKLTLREIQNLSAEEDFTVPCIADRVKTRTRKNVSGEKHEDREQQLPLTDTVCGTFQEKNDSFLDKKKSTICNEFDTISSGKSRQEQMSYLWAKANKEYEMEKCASDRFSGEKVEEIHCKAHVHSKKVHDKELCDTSDKPTITSKESGLDHRPQGPKTPLMEDGEESRALISPKKSSDHLSKNQTGCIGKTDSEKVDTDSKDHAVRQQKSKRKKINRVLSVDLQNQISQQQQSHNKVRSIGEDFEEDLNTTTVRNRNSALAEKDGLGTREDKVQDTTKEKREHIDENECPPSTSCVADSLGENVRQCRRSVREGMYKETAIVFSTDAGKSCSSRSSKKVNCPEIKNAREETESFDDADAEDSNVDDGQGCKTKMLKRLSRKKPKRKSYEKQIRRSVDWNQKDERCEDQNPVDEIVVSPSDVIVPNIAERVKRRRSCTHFNHEGQYANGGEGAEEKTPKLVKTINKHRRLLKARKRLWNNNSQRRVRLSGDSQITIPSSEQSEGKTKSFKKTPTSSILGKNKGSAASNAVVIRRSRSSFNALSKTDVNWSKCISDKDWSQCETETDDHLSPNNASGSDTSGLPKALPQGCQSQASSTTGETKDQIKVGEESADVSQPMNDTSNRSSGEGKDAINETRRRRRSLSLRKAVQTLQLKQLKISHAQSQSHSHSQACFPSNINTARSPRLRLKIQRNPIDESYSSTLEEIQDDVPNVLDSSCPGPNPDISVKEDERSSPSANRDPVRLDDELRAPLPTTPQKQKIPSLKLESHSASVCNKDMLKTQSQDKGIAHFITNDHRKDSISGISNKDERSGVKSESRKLKKQSSHSSRRKCKTKLEDKDHHLKASQADSIERNSVNAKEAGTGQDVGETSSTTVPLLTVDKIRSLGEKNRDDKEGGQDNSGCTGVDNSFQEGNISKDDMQIKKKITSKEMKSQKPAKQHSKRKHISREDLIEVEDSSRPAKKIKLSDCIVSLSPCDHSKEDGSDLVRASNEAVNKNLFTKGVSSHNPECDTSEVDFPKLHSEKRRESRAKIKLLWKDSESCRGQRSPANESHDEEPHSVFQEENTQASLNTNLGDILAFVPTFSSPGKTNSSWDDACDSYLNTSTKSEFPSANQLTPLPAMFSPTPMSLNDSQPGSAVAKSPGHISPRKTNKGHFSPEVFGQFTSPIKRKPVSTDHLEGSPVIEKVDSVISFNHMSPQRLHFSPKKCEKSLGHRRNFNSPSKKF